MYEFHTFPPKAFSVCWKIPGLSCCLRGWHGRPLSRCTQVEQWLQFAESSRYVRWNQMGHHIPRRHLCQKAFTSDKSEDRHRLKLLMRLVEQSSAYFDRSNIRMEFLAWTTMLSSTPTFQIGHAEGQFISLRENLSTELSIVQFVRTLQTCLRP